MSEESKKLIIEDLPTDICEDDLRIVLGNKKSTGGGPIEDVELRENGDTCLAVITFKKSDAVDRILRRGDTVIINNVEAKVKRFDSCKSKSKSKTQKKYSPPSTLTSDDEGTSKNAAKRKQSTTSESDEDTEEEDLQQPWRTTIKAKVIDVTQSKDSYQLYFEDRYISQGSFDENSLMLDGLNKNIYVTFDSRKAALATCRFNHKPDSNLSKVEMATKEDFDTYDNLISVHGHRPISTEQDKRELEELLKENAKIEVLDVFQYDEPRSAIIKFDQHTCEDINALTWISVEYGGPCLIVAPVFKTKCVKVTGLSPQSSKAIIHRYFSNERHSGGGEVATVSRPDKGECIVTFKAESSVDGVIKKDNHVLERCKLKVSIYHSCLSKDVYRQQIEPMQQQFMKTNIKEFTGTCPKPLQRGQTPLTQRRALHPELTCVVDELCNSYKIKRNDGKLQCTLPFCKFGSDFLKSHEKILIEMMHSANCKYNFSLNGSQSVMTIDPDCPEKITDKKVIEILNDGANQVLDYMSTFKTAQFNIDKSEIHEFQKFYQQRCSEEFVDELYFDHQDNVAVFISDRDKNWIKGMVNSLYHKFLSNRDRQFDASGYGEEEMSDSKDDDSESDNESDNACQQKPRGPDNRRSSGAAQRKKAPPTLPRKPNFTNGQHSTKDKEDDKHLTFVDEEALEEKDEILFQFTNFHKDVEKEYKPLKIIIDAQKHLVIIKSDTKTKIDSVKLKLLQKARDFKSRNIESIFSQQQKELLMKQNVQDKINKELKEKAFLAQVKCTADTVTLYHDKGVADDVLTKIVKSYVVKKEMPLDPDMVLTFQSEKGQKFLSELCEDSDSMKECSFAELKDNSLLIIASSQQLELLMNDVNQFVEENKRYEESVPFSSGKQRYVNKYLKDEFKRIKSFLKDHGATITENKEDIVVHGLKDGVTLGEQKLHEICERIATGNTNLDFFGIKEFLQTLEGKALLKTIESSKKCIIMPKSDSQQGEDGAKSSPGILTPLAKPAGIIARAKVGNCSFKFLQGDITGLDAETIINPIESSLKCQTCLGKSILSKAGQIIETELSSFGARGSPGTVVQTSAGRLNNCQAIMHVVCPVFSGSERDILERAITACLNKITSQGFTTVATPAIGTGKIFKFPPMVACDVMMTSLHQVLTAGGATLRKIYLCDVKVEPVKELIDRFKSVFQQEVEEVEDFRESPLKATPTPAPRPSVGKADKANKNFRETSKKKASQEEASLPGNSMQGSPGAERGGRRGKSGGKNEVRFGSVKLSIKKGDIVLEKCDAILSGVRETMDLSKSGAVCKALLLKCGSALQDECNDKKDEMAQNGFTATSAPNLNCKQIYHVSMDRFAHSWHKCISQVLKDAEKQGLTSVALPALGSGAKRADSQQIKKTIFNGVKYFSGHSQGTLTDVRLVVFSQNLLDEFTGEGATYRHPPRDKEDDSQTPSEVHVSSKVKLTIYAEDVSKIVSAEKELHSVFAKAFREQTEKEPNVKNMDCFKVKELEDEGRKHCVLVSVDVDGGLIIMKGFKADDFLHVQKLLHKYLIEAMENHHRSLHKAVISAVHWQYEQGKKWRDFEPMSNSELEREHHNYSDHCNIVDSIGRKYKIDFKTMKEYSLDENGQRRGHTLNIRRYDHTKEGEPLPKKWETMDNAENLKLVILKAGSPEYKQAEKRFIDGGVNVPVKKIERIQNKTLYQLYKANKRGMKKRNGKDHENEKRLFHGSDIPSVTIINENGFNRSYRVNNATGQDKGVCFAVNSSYFVNAAVATAAVNSATATTTVNSALATPAQGDGAVNSTQATAAQGDCMMYIVRVLTGISTPSDSAMTVLPPQPGKNYSYDSGNAGNIFIIFNDAQAYPEYLITF